MIFRMHRCLFVIIIYNAYVRSTCIYTYIYVCLLSTMISYEFSYVIYSYLCIHAYVFNASFYAFMPYYLKLNNKINN